MKILNYSEDVVKYLNTHKNDTIEVGTEEYELIMKYVKKFKTLNKHTKILEVGNGYGWFLIIYFLEGLNCEGTKNLA